MLAVERRKTILQMLQANEIVTVLELSKKLNVTEETIRRDLEKLEKDNLLRRTHGGAVLNESTTVDLPFSLREVTNIENKKSIGKAVAELINDGDTIMFDSSSTALQTASFIKDKKHITVITNSVNVVVQLANSNDCQVISTGGILKKNSLSFTGHWAEKVLENYNVNLAIISCKGVDMEKGITESNQMEAEVKKQMVKTAKKTVLVVDHTKFDKVSFVKLLPFNKINTIITDHHLSDEWKQHLNSHNIELLYGK